MREVLDCEPDDTGPLMPASFFEITIVQSPANIQGYYLKYIPARVQLTAMMGKAEYLTGKGVEFVGKDLMINEEDWDELFGLRVRSAPALVVDGEVVIGFDKVHIDALLNL